MNKNSCLVHSLLLCAFLSLGSTSVHAQLTPDNTLGTEASKLTPNVLINGASADLINGGAQRGNNLFHSFNEFNIKDGQGVYFANPSGVVNILTRVTGNNASNILGTLGVDGGANLFLINPNGILFGRNASLDVRGSFVGTTANGVQFGSQGNFSATNPEAPEVLTVNPSALFFNQINPNAGIQNNSVAPAGKNQSGSDAVGLQVTDGKSLLLIGGNVSMEGGQLNAFGGRVELGGLASPGTVGLQVDSNNISSDFPNNIDRANVFLTNGASVYVQSPEGGNITVNARNLDILKRSILFTAIEPGLKLVRTTGNIVINATNNINVVNSVVANRVLSKAKGNAGNINITATTLSLSDGAALSASTFGSGKAGNIAIRASDKVDLNNGNLYSQAELGSSGSGGNVSIETRRLSVRNNSQISTGTISTSSGGGGNLTINALNSVDITNNGGIFTDTEGIGAAGDLNISTKQLNLQDGGFIFGGARSTGRGGNMTINAERVDILGVSASGEFSAILNQSTGAGDAGAITINTNKLSIQGGGGLAARTAGGGKGGTVTINASDAVELSGASPDGNVTSLSSQTKGTGDGGIIAINTRRLNVENGAQISVSTFGKGKGGNLEVAASDSVDLSGRAKSGFSSGLFAQVNKGGTGDAGNLTVTTKLLTLTNGAKISAATLGAGQGGNLSIIALGGAITLIGTATDGTTSSITAGTDGTGNAGNVTISTGKLIVQAGAAVEASTQGFGEGGSLIINASDLINLEGVSANGRFFSGLTTQTLGAKASGNLILNTPQLKIQNGARVSVGSLGTGRAGSLEINARSIQLDNRGGIFSGTNSGNGGNISLRLQDLLLRRNSFISATAGTAQLGGDGGNINIDSRFILAVPSENSDITADAFTGRGGNIFIRTQGIFGIEPHAVPSNETSDITASSQRGVQGEIFITEPDVKPAQGLIELPEKFVDASNQIGQICPSGLTAKTSVGKFIMVGRGGLSPNPITEPLESDVVNGGWITLNTNAVYNTTLNRSKPITATTPIVEAQGWVKNIDGSLELIALAPKTTPNARASVATCQT